MKKMMLILTGGTIGSSEHHGIISADQNGEYRIVQLYQQKYNDVDWTIFQPLNILSENLNPLHWETIVNFILGLDLNDTDGMIITHGSDTLSYSSAMLSMCLCHLNIPVAITAANYVPDHPKSNALDNIRAAVLLCEHMQKGVFTVFKNADDSDCSIYLPTRMYEADRFFDKFSSADGKLFAKVTDDRFVICSAIEDEIRKKNKAVTDKLILRRKVMMIRPYPSLNYENIVIPSDVSAVLHTGYHSSTANSDLQNKRYSALTLLDKCRRCNVDFYISSFKKNHSSLYETGNILLHHGAVPLFDITNESSLAKLLLLYNTNTENKQYFLANDIYFENMQIDR